jgi:transposase
MLAETVDGVIGVDTARDHHAAAVCGPLGAVVDSGVFAATGEGYQALLGFARAAVPGRRCWAIEGTGSFGAGLTAVLLAAGERVVEVSRPARPRRRGAAKNDTVDAIRAARDALAATDPITPKRAVLVDQLRIVDAQTAAMNLLHALLLTAPVALRDRLAGHTGERLIDACWALPDDPTLASDPRAAATSAALATVAERIMFLAGERRRHDAHLSSLLSEAVPSILAAPGIGPVSAAQLLIAYGHHGRIHHDAAFAALAGAAPIEASSGQITRHRLNRAGDRQLNRALHTIAVTRMRHDPRTRHYVERRRAEGKTDREIRRCLKRYLARNLYRRLRHAGPALDAT